MKKYCFLKNLLKLTLFSQRAGFIFYRNYILSIFCKIKGFFTAGVIRNFLGFFVMMSLSLPIWGQDSSVPSLVAGEVERPEVDKESANLTNNGNNQGLNQNLSNQGLNQNGNRQEASTDLLGVQKRVEMEWEPIVGAEFYEIEISTQGANPQFQKVTGTIWNGRLAPGIYQFRIRALDAKGIKSEWSSTENLSIILQAIQKEAPMDRASVTSLSDKEENIEFRWESNSDSAEYEVSIYSNEKSSEDKAFNETIRVRGSSLKKKLPVGRNYFWSVRAVSGGSLEDRHPFQLTLQGKNLDKPEIIPPASSFVRSIEWKNTPNAEAYRFVLQRQNRKSQKWETVLSGDSHKQTSIDLDQKLPGGNYRIGVSAKANLRGPSPFSLVVFKVKSGDRSPAAEETYEIRQSIDRISGWFSSASYLMTIFDYQSRNFDRSNSTLTYSAIGGTGRFGLGYLKSPSTWGFQSIFDVSGINVGGATTLFMSTEANAVHRKNWGRFGEWRNILGLYYKELPDTIGIVETQTTETDLIKALGPHYGFEYWWAVDSQFGIQFNGHAYLSALKVQTPNGQDLVMTPSWQMGVMGSYRWKPRLTALAGYAYRMDQMKYKTLKTANSTSSGNSDNSLTMTGHYLNFYLEWDMF